MTKPRPHCDQSPTGSHHRLMEWRDMPNGLREYWGVCKWCGNPKREDENLGMKKLNVLPDGTTYFRGKRSEFRLARSKGVQE